MKKGNSLVEHRESEGLITSFDQIEPLVEEIYQAMFLCKRIKSKTTVLSKKEMEKAFGENSKGHCYFSFSLFNIPFFPKIYLCSDTTQNMLIVAGHENGHLQKPYFSDNKDEETKAFLFQLSWEDVIMSNNIGGYAQFIGQFRQSNSDLNELREFPIHYHAYQLAKSIHRRNHGDWENELNELIMISKPPTDYRRIGFSVH